MSTISTEISVEEIEVAEELEPVKYVQGKRTGTLAFAMAQASRQNLALAFNLGADAANGTTALDPPAPGGEVSVSFVLQTNQGARWYFPSGKNGGTFEMSRAKSGKTLIGVEFNLEKLTNLPLFRVFPASGGLV